MKPSKLDQIKEALTLLGWKEDSYGHMKKASEQGNTYRIKIQAISVRVEKRIDSEWFKVSNAYIKDVVILDDSRVQIGKVVIGDKS